MILRTSDNNYSSSLIKLAMFSGWKRSSITNAKVEKIPGGKIKLGNVFIIRGKHTTNSKQWVFNLMGSGKDVSARKRV